MLGIGHLLHELLQELAWVAAYKCMAVRGLRRWDPIRVLRQLLLSLPLCLLPLLLRPRGTEEVVLDHRTHKGMPIENSVDPYLPFSE